MPSDEPRHVTQTACDNCNVVSEVEYTTESDGMIRGPPKTDAECAVCGEELNVDSDDGWSIV